MVIGALSNKFIQTSNALKGVGGEVFFCNVSNKASKASGFLRLQSIALLWVHVFGIHAFSKYFRRACGSHFHVVASYLVAHIIL